MTAGFWHTNFFPTDFYQEDLWQDYGVPTAPDPLGLTYDEVFTIFFGV